jgi:hypothetical protein
MGSDSAVKAATRGSLENLSQVAFLKRIVASRTAKAAKSRMCGTHRKLINS